MKQEKLPSGAEDVDEVKGDEEIHPDLNEVYADFWSDNGDLGYEEEEFDILKGDETIEALDMELEEIRKGYEMGEQEDEVGEKMIEAYMGALDGVEKLDHSIEKSFMFL